MSIPSDAAMEKIKGRLTKIDPANRTVTNTYKFNLTIDGKIVKTWILDLKNVSLTCGDGTADATLTMADSDMCAIVNGTMSAKEALNQDKIDVDGDVALVMLLEPFISSL